MHYFAGTMHFRGRWALPFWCVCASLAPAATLEKLSLDEMARQSTLIVRGTVSSCTGEARNSIIYTRCYVSVSEVWKGQTTGAVSFVTPGGSAQGLRQTFTGTPKFLSGQEYVLFLWAGKSGVNQIIGLSQGVFDLQGTTSSQLVAHRARSGEMMLDKSGTPVTDEDFQMKVNDLRREVRQALSGNQGSLR